VISLEIQSPSILCQNFRSATVANKLASEKQILSELSFDRYVISETVPHIISSLGAIEKADGSVRLIHDLSRPEGGVNGLTDDTSVKFPNKALKAE
jgi:hypothetical protein